MWNCVFGLGKTLAPLKRFYTQPSLFWSVGMQEMMSCPTTSTEKVHLVRSDGSRCQPSVFHFPTIPGITEEVPVARWCLVIGGKSRYEAFPWGSLWHRRGIYNPLWVRPFSTFQGLVVQTVRGGGGGVTHTKTHTSSSISVPKERALGQCSSQLRG